MSNMVIDVNGRVVGETVRENGADTALSKLERRRLEVQAKREANTAKAKQIAEERELALLDDEERYEDARAKAYEDQNIGPDRCIGGLIEGVAPHGYVLFKWPNDVQYTRFQDKGILKPNGLTTTLAEELTSTCLLYPTQQDWKEIRRRNPTTAVQVASLLLEAMAPTEDASGKGLKSSLQRR